MAASIRTIRSVTCRCRPRGANGTARSFATRARSGPRYVWATAGRSLVSTHSTAIFEFSIEDSNHADRKSTRLNSSHLVISYAVCCLKKKRKYRHEERASRDTAEARAHGLTSLH